ncbi:MAG: Wzz/FepE/Etk N-terminal domain-containing protein [Planktomarina sp.]|nr:Wzz/FepE/Etk N-terminal domain-containing protein [Planktomarina sp.]
MTDFRPDLADDEIDLRELFTKLWRGRWVIASLCSVALVLASFYLHVAARKYTVSMTFKPVIEEGAGPNLAGLGGLASLAGVSLPQSGSGDFATFRTLLRSEEVAERVIAATELLPAIFKNEWDAQQAQFRKPPRGLLGRSLSGLKSILTGDEKRDYIALNPQRLSIFMDRTLGLSVNNETGFLTVSAESEDPETLVALIVAATEATDQLMKERYIVNAEQTLQFYQSKILTSRSREHREALAKLISAEDQKLMLTSEGRHFVAEPLTRATTSVDPTSPKSVLVLALALVLGLFSGAALVVIRSALSNTKVT